MRSEYCKGLAADSKMKVVCLVRILQVYVNILQLNKTVSCGFEWKREHYWWIYKHGEYLKCAHSFNVKVCFMPKSVYLVLVFIFWKKKKMNQHDSFQHHQLLLTCEFLINFCNYSVIILKLKKCSTFTVSKTISEYYTLLYQNYLLNLFS